ncbi:MAG: ribosome maturation factor RimP [Ornithinimicrobium sp.]
MANAPQVGAIAEVATAGLHSTGVVVDDIVLSSAGRRRLLRVFVARDLSALDSDDLTSTVEPLSLDEVAQATRTLNDVLDHDDAMGEQPYTLEVSSVGVATPLTRPEHFRRNVSRLVQIIDDAGVERTSRLLAASSEGIQLQASQGQWLAYDKISRATVQVEFNRATTGEQG